MDERTIGIIVGLAISAMAVLAVLIRMAMEHERLFARYRYLKALWQREEEQRRLAAEQAAKIARAVNVPGNTPPEAAPEPRAGGSARAAG